METAKAIAGALNKKYDTNIYSRKLFTIASQLRQIIHDKTPSGTYKPRKPASRTGYDPDFEDRQGRCREKEESECKKNLANCNWSPKTNRCSRKPGPRAAAAGEEEDPAVIDNIIDYISKHWRSISDRLGPAPETETRARQRVPVGKAEWLSESQGQQGQEEEGARAASGRQQGREARAARAASGRQRGREGEGSAGEREGSASGRAASGRQRVERQGAKQGARQQAKQQAKQAKQQAKQKAEQEPDDDDL